MPSPPFPHSLLNNLIPVTIRLSSTSCFSLSRLLIDIKVPSSIGGKTLWRAAFKVKNFIKNYSFKLKLPVASRTTDISVGLPKPERNKIAETIFLYNVSRSSFVLALESVISLITG